MSTFILTSGQVRAVELLYSGRQMVRESLLWIMSHFSTSVHVPIVILVVFIVSREAVLLRLGEPTSKQVAWLLCEYWRFTRRLPIIILTTIRTVHDGYGRISIIYIITYIKEEAVCYSEMFVCKLSRGVLWDVQMSHRAVPRDMRTSHATGHHLTVRTITKPVSSCNLPIDITNPPMRIYAIIQAVLGTCWDRWCGTWNESTGHCRLILDIHTYPYIH